MALIPCKDCKKEFSTDAKRCPSCGARKKNPLLFWGIIAAIIYFVIFPMTKTNLTPSMSRPRAVPPPVVADNTPPNSWQVSEGHSAMDDSKGLRLSKDSEQLVDTWPNKRVRPTLSIQCHEGKTGLFLNIKASVQPIARLHDKHGVEIRIDTQRSYMELWAQSPNGGVLSAPKPIVLARKLANSKKVLLQYIPFNSPLATVEFDTSELGKVLPQVAVTCNWGSTK